MDHLYKKVRFAGKLALGSDMYFDEHPVVEKMCRQIEEAIVSAARELGEFTQADLSILSAFAHLRVTAATCFVSLNADDNRQEGDNNGLA